MTTPKLIIKMLTTYFRFLAVGVAGLVLALGYLWIIAPKFSQVNSTQTKTRQADVARLKLQQTYLADLKKSNARFREVFSSAETLKAINDFLPSDPDFPGLLLTVKNLIAQSGLTMDSFTVAQGGQTAVAAAAVAPSADGSKTGAAGAQAATIGGVSVKTQDASVTISGGKTYESFKNLLTNIESSRRLFDVVSLSFSAGTATGPANQTKTGGTWTMVLRSYYLPASTR